jgi:hypothetical protein
MGVNKAMKNILLGAALLVAVLIVKKLWLPEGILGLLD